MTMNGDTPGTPNANSNSSTISLEVNYDYQSAHRFPAWMALSVCSAVCLAAITTQTDSRDAAENWALSVSILSLMLSFAAVVAYLLMRSVFVGQLPTEGALLALLVALWCAGLPVIMNPNRTLAVASNPTEGLVIVNANLYFFSWLSLAGTLYLAGSFLQELGFSPTASGFPGAATPQPTSARWLGLCACSVVVFGSGWQVLNATPQCELEFGTTSAYCRRTRWAMGLGLVSAALSGLITVLSQRKQLQLLVEFGTTTVLLILWCFGVGFITFGSTPGATISNLYFATWIAFLLCVFIFAQSFREVLAAQYAAHATNDTGTSNTNGEDGYEQQHPGANPVVQIQPEELAVEDL